MTDSSTGRVASGVLGALLSGVIGGVAALLAIVAVSFVLGPDESDTTFSPLTVIAMLMIPLVTLICAVLGFMRGWRRAG